MFTFNVFSNGQSYKFNLSIEHPTHLLVLEQVVKGEDYPRYIRMTTQQADKFRNIIFGGNFSSTTIPRNDYSHHNCIITIKCHEEGQVIEFPLEAFAEFDRYYKKHKAHIERYDARFRSRR